MDRRAWLTLGTLALLLAACGREPTPPPPPVPPPPVADCSSVTPVQLAVGEHQVVDPAATGGCVRVPTAGAGGAEYIVVLASTAAVRTTDGVSGSYHVVAGNPGAAASPPAAAPRVDRPLGPRRALSAQQAFHDMLRRREAELSADPATRITAAPRSVAAAPPVVGNVRTFKVCTNLQCSAFTDVPATAKYVGTAAAIYLDNEVPQDDPLQAADFQDLGTTFDTHHYPIDTVAFGRESDIDNNQRIVILMTDAVNALTPDCTNGRVLGYFFGLDLTAGSPNSNQGEVFYTFVPSPATADCNAVTREQAVRSVKPTLIHELQHMISWNQHVIVRGGSSEEIWLNEALSHFAEELGGRQIPNAECPGFSSCRSQYISSDIINAYDFLTNTEANFLVYPISSQGTLEERGASWYFLRWVADQFATVDTLATDFTNQVVQTSSTGASNLAQKTGETFSRMVVEWLLAAYLDDLDGFTALSKRLTLDSWGLRTIWLDPRNSQIFPDGFPVQPQAISGTFTRSGTLRAGSGRHFRLVQGANGAAIDFQALGNVAGAPLAAELSARIGIARVK